MGFIATIIVGLIAGWLASLIMKTGTGLIGDLIIGVVGGFLGGLLSQLLLGVNLMSGINVTSIITALVGAIVLLAIVKAIRR
ncbi:MAG: GlsB/YeaQ/YmgE family stress response membrane protein [Anaerolineaceae bacterium]|nr:GlsB/YeaQ/YmgE family stress response membrane protein [Anaerolineaceae bacterium]MCB9100720.1 GlsB/YeaQ/YmgE family stress response membrane protein [Anaerolineales bacterium]